MERLEDRVLRRAYRLDHHGFSYGLGKRAAVAEEVHHKGRDKDLLRTSPRVLERFLCGGYLHCIFKMRVNKGFVQGAENAGDKGCEGSL